MSTTVRTFGTALGTLRRAPMLVFLSVPPVVGVLSSTIVALVLSFVSIAFIIPTLGFAAGGVPSMVLFAGLVGAATVSIRDGDDASVAAYRQSIGRNWKEVSWVSLMLVFIYIGFLIFALIGLFAVGLAGLIPLSVEAATDGWTGLHTFFAVVGLLGAALLMATQFYDVAIVVGGYSGVTALMESADLLRAAPLSVVGYSLLRVCLFAGSFLAPFVVDIWVAEPIPIHVLGGSSLVLGVLGTALAGAYHVAYYSEHRLSETATTADAVSGSGQVQRNRAQGPGARDNRVTTTDMLFRDKTAGEDASGADADEGEWGAGGDVDGGLGTGGDVGGDGDGGF